LLMYYDWSFGGGEKIYHMC